MSALLCHFLLYLFIFRHFEYFRQEKTIFMFHMVFFLLLFITCLFLWWIDVLGTATLLGILSIALIYHMTFLSVWSLAEGSYSLQILVAVTHYKMIPESELITKTEYIGNDKKQNRLEHLLKSGIVKKIDHNRFTLSRFGKFIHYSLHAIKIFSNIKTRG